MATVTNFNEVLDGHVGPELECVDRPYPGFIKICTYFPDPAKVWVNDREWAKRQAAPAGLGFRALANGFATSPASHTTAARGENLKR